MSDDNTQTDNPFARRGFIAAAVVVGVILLAGVIVAVTTITAPEDGPVATPTNSSGPPATGSDESICGLKGFEEKSTLTEAPATEWELVGTVATPAKGSPSGPGQIEANAFRSCYAHTAEGALYAAVGYFAVSSDVRNVPRVYELLAAGPVRDEIEMSPQAGEASSARLQVAGFKVNSYSGDEAIIDVAWRVTSENGALVSFPTVLRWESGDWKIVFAEDGPPFAASPLQSLGGYIPWAGV